MDTSVRVEFVLWSAGMCEIGQVCEFVVPVRGWVSL